MALVDTVAHTTSHDGTFSTAGIAAWDGTAAHTIAHTGVVSGGIRYGTGTTTEDYSALLAANGVVVGGGAGAAPFTDAGLTYNSATDALTVAGQIITSATGTVSAPSINLGASGAGYGFSSGGGHIKVIVGSAEQFSWYGGGEVRLAGAAPYLRFSDNFNASIAYATANAFVFGSGTSVAGGAASRTEINKNVTGIANNTATATLTVTIPNGAHSAGGKIVFKGAAGAGGAIGADEFSALIEYDFVVTRTTGANAVATLSGALLTAITASVVGGTTPTISAALSAISGAVGATNAFTFNVTINALTGSSTNHTCFCYAILQNDNASGVSIA